MASSRRSLFGSRPKPAGQPLADDDLLEMDESDFSDDGIVVTKLRLGGLDAEDLPSEESDEWGFVSDLEVIDRHAGERFESEDRDDVWDFDEPHSEEVRRDSRFSLGLAAPAAPTDPEPTLEESGVKPVPLGVVALLGSGGLLALAGAAAVALIAGVAVGWAFLSDPEQPEPVAVEAPPPEPVAPVVVEPEPVVDDTEPPVEEVVEAEPPPVEPEPAKPRRARADPEPVAEAPEPDPEPEPPPLPVEEEEVREAGPPPVEGPVRRGLFGRKKKK